ncbi:MAG TPA: alpha/beta hydrolase [Gemmatimonadales bacterium]|nr:alpha/beta hydrolase [Gemmatimonadales bacterium]
MILHTMALLASLDSGVVRHIEVAPGEILHTTVIGSGEPVVLIPGIFGGAFGYRKVIGPLVDRGYRCIVIEPLGYGRSSYPERADYSFTAQTERVRQALDSLGVRNALFIANSTGASIALRLAIAKPELVRGILSIDGGPAESAGTPGMKKAFRMGGFITKLAVNESKLRHDVRAEILKNSGDTSWVTKKVIREYTAGQAVDVNGAIDALHSMSKSKEATSLHDQLDDIQVPVRLLVGGVPHPSGVKQDERDLLAERIPDFALESVPGSGQYVHEEQPEAVLRALGDLDQAAD